MPRIMRKYTKLEVKVLDEDTVGPDKKGKYNPATIILKDMDITVARIRVRALLDKQGNHYAQVTGFMGDNAVMITGVRSTKMRHFPVATATRG